MVGNIFEVYYCVLYKCKVTIKEDSDNTFIYKTADQLGYVRYKLGTFCCTSNFSRLLISVLEPIEGKSGSWSSKDGLVICAPAKSRSQALEIAKKISGKSGWLSNVIWD